jgi:hypothetical protein
LNIIIQYTGEIIIILVKREWIDKFIISSWRTKVLSKLKMSLYICTDEYLIRFNIHFSHALFIHRRFQETYSVILYYSQRLWYEHIRS